MNILAIDTSCDETSAAIVNGRRTISSVVYSQALLHNTWGGVVPSLARRAHEERINWVIEKTLKKAHLNFSDISTVAVTYGPGLAIALGVGITKAKDLATRYKKKLVGINHMEGHIYSCFVQNSAGKPERDFNFPYLALLVSGGHTELVYFKDHLSYDILGKTRDDAAGEAFDKAARILGFGYPGGQAVERLAASIGNIDKYHFPRPMIRSKNLDFSFSGLKTSFLYYVQSLSEEKKLKELAGLASSFQEAVCDTLILKTKMAMEKTGVKRILVGGGVAVNQRLRSRMRQMVGGSDAAVFFPPYKYLNFDNATMIGVAATYRTKKELFTDAALLDREPRLSLLQSSL